MHDERAVDYYELLQVSPNAEPETIQRVFRLMAQRFHPDNQESGDANRFRQVREAFDILSDPAQRAQYDIRHQELQQTRWRLVTEGGRTENDYQLEQATRLTILEALYTKRRMEPGNPGLFILDLEGLIGRPREHLEFTMWYLIEKKLVQRGDNTRIFITAEGADHLERNYQTNLQNRRLRAPAETQLTAR